MTRQHPIDMDLRLSGRQIIGLLLVLAVLCLPALLVPGWMGARAPSTAGLWIVTVAVQFIVVVACLYRNAALPTGRPVFTRERNRWLMFTLFGRRAGGLILVAVLFVAAWLGHLIANIILYGRPWQ